VIAARWQGVGFALQRQRTFARASRLRLGALALARLPVNGGCRTRMMRTVDIDSDRRQSQSIGRQSPVDESTVSVDESTVSVESRRCVQLSRV
jgi:hypothetical protein